MNHNLFFQNFTKWKNFSLLKNLLDAIAVSMINSIKKAYIWNWVIIIDTAKRQHSHLEDLFLEHKSFFFEKE